MAVPCPCPAVGIGHCWQPTYLTGTNREEEPGKAGQSFDLHERWLPDGETELLEYNEAALKIIFILFNFSLQLRIRGEIYHVPRCGGSLWKGLTFWDIRDGEEE